MEPMIPRFIIELCPAYFNDNFIQTYRDLVFEIKAKKLTTLHVDLYIHSPIRLHGVMLKLVKHRDNFTFFSLHFIDLALLNRMRSGFG
jgi:hypothetical protein